MTRLAHLWRAMEPEQRLAALASLGLLVTMFFPWYGLQSLNRGTINSHTINAFGDVSFVEAAVFLVAAGVVTMVLARADGRDFHMPGGDGTIVLLAGAWAALLIFYRVFDRPAGHGYPVGIEWGFFLAFVAAGGLAYAGWRMRGIERPEPPATASRGRRRRTPPGERAPSDSSTDVTALVPASPRSRPARSAPIPAERRPSAERPAFPPPPSWSAPGAEERSPRPSSGRSQDPPTSPRSSSGRPLDSSGSAPSPPRPPEPSRARPVSPARAPDRPASPPPSPSPSPSPEEEQLSFEDSPPRPE